MLRGGEVEREAGRLLAKSLPDVTAQTLDEWKGWRHEAMSAALLTAAEKNGEYDVVDWELVRWLVGTSHGRGRPLFPPNSNAPDETVSVDFLGQKATGSTRHGLDHLGSGWLELFHRLNGRYGLWGLAWLEALLRLADQQVSAEEAQ